MPDQSASPRRGGRHGSRRGQDEGRPAEALAGDEGALGSRGRRARPEQPPGREAAPDRGAAPARDVPSDRGAPPGRDVLSDRGAPPGRDVLPDHGAPPGRDVLSDRGAPPGRDVLPDHGAAPGRNVLLDRGAPLGRDTVSGRARAPGDDLPPGQDESRRTAQRRRDAPPGRDETDRRPGPSRPAGRRPPRGWDEAAGPHDVGVAAPPRGFGEQDETRTDGGRSRRRAAEQHADLDEDDRAGRGSRAGRSGGRAGKHRVRTVLLAVLVLVVVGAGAVAALKFMSRGSGQSHVLVAPSRLGSYVRRPQLEQQMNAKALQQQVVAKSAGQASHVVSAVYENSAGVHSTAPPQIFLFIGGNLAGESPAGFISSFTAQFKGATATSAGPQGGQAACVDARGSAAGSVALCTWADSDTFGVVASPTMSLSQLAAQMRTIRPLVEQAAK